MSTTLLKIGDSIELEEMCAYCYGKHPDTLHPSFLNSYGKCKWCNGDGVVLTEDGRTLLKFIKKYLNEFELL